MNTITAAQTRVRKELANIGSTVSRLTHSAAVLSNRTLNYTEAASRITDADVAFESSRLVSTQILQRAAAAVLAQANLQPAIALQLLNS